MNDRERLIELLLDFEGEFNSFVFDRERLADYLIANGVTIQKHGRWVRPEEFYWRPECSECGYYGSAFDEPIVPFNFCPNCGTKMMEEKEHG